MSRLLYQLSYTAEWDMSVAQRHGRRSAGDSDKDATGYFEPLYGIEP